MNKKLERKITRWYGSCKNTRLWIAKHWHRYIKYGCSMCWREGCDCDYERKNINNPKGFAVLAEYCYKTYNHPYT